MAAWENLSEEAYEETLEHARQFVRAEGCERPGEYAFILIEGDECRRVAVERGDELRWVWFTIDDDRKVELYAAGDFE